MLTVSFVLVILALLITAASAAGRAPIWASVFILCVVELLQLMPR